MKGVYLLNESRRFNLILLYYVTGVSISFQIEEVGGQALAHRGDVSNESDVASTVKIVRDNLGITSLY